MGLVKCDFNVFRFCQLCLLIYDIVAFRFINLGIVGRFFLGDKQINDNDN
jgi:hypothetical protein